MAAYPSLRRKLPTILKARYRDDAVLSKLLHAWATALDDAARFLAVVHADARLATADPRAVSLLWEARIPGPIPEADALVVEALDGTLLEPAPSLFRFLNALADDPLYLPELHIDHPYWIDREQQALYVRRPYETLVIKQIAGGVVVAQWHVNLSPYPVWNVFDEFGLELGLPRLFQESNVSYQGRLLDVRRYPPSPTPNGLAWALARELGWVYDEIWADGSVDWPLSTPMIIPETLQVDEAPWPAFMTYVDESGRLTLKGDPAYVGRSRRVRYYAGIALDALAPERAQDDPALLDEWIRQVFAYAPVLWGQARWDEGFWDTVTPKDGVAFLPAMGDRF